MTNLSKRHHNPVGKHLAAFIALLLSLTFLQTVEAAHFKPIVTNFTTNDYGKDTGVQNWCCMQGRNGEILIANQKGLIVYDGFRWKSVAVPGSMVIRSLLYDNGRIYVGSYEEFGYFTYDDYGSLSYHSLMPLLDKKPLPNEEIWNILKVGNRIYFQSFDAYFVYDGKKVVTYYDPENRPLYLHNIGGNIYAQLIGKGYCQIVNGQYVPHLSRSATDNDIVAALPLKGKGRAILCTESNGLFLMDGKKTVPFATDADDELRRNSINRATMTKDSMLIVGTILNGIYAFDLKGRLLWNYNIETGLNNNSVLGLFCDRDNNVWAALDNGLALIHTGSSCSVMIPDRGEQQIGMIYDLNVIGSRLYMASNQGLYTYDFHTGDIRYIKGGGNQNWHISTFEGTTFVGNNKMTLELKGGGNSFLSRTPRAAAPACACYVMGKNVPSSNRPITNCVSTKCSPTGSGNTRKSGTSTLLSAIWRLTRAA